MAKHISLNKGLFAIVDDEDFESLSKFKWRSNHNRRNIYVQRASPTKPKTVMMHRQVLGITDGKITIDHINGNGLDNRKENLRIATGSQNAGNSRMRIGTFGKYKGVHFFNEKWVARIGHQNKRYYLGRFETREAAALACNKKYTELFGEFAKLNEVDLG